MCLPGKDESKVEKLRSILAQLEYKYQINHWNSKGVPFKDHLYVAEVHPVTGIQFCEREDEGHIFKVHVYRIEVWNWFYAFPAAVSMCMF